MKEGAAYLTFNSQIHGLFFSLVIRKHSHQIEIKVLVRYKRKKKTMLNIIPNLRAFGECYMKIIDLDYRVPLFFF